MNSNTQQAQRKVRREQREAKERLLWMISDDILCRSHFTFCPLCSSQWSASGRDKNLRLCRSRCRMSCPSVSRLPVNADSLIFSERKDAFLFMICCFFPGLTVSDITVNSSGLLHTIRLQHFHQVAFINSSLSISDPVVSLTSERCVFRSTRLSGLILQASVKSIKVSLCFNTVAGIHPHVKT